MPDDKLIRRPLLDPLLLAMKSRRVIVALAALAVGLLVAAVPELAPVRDELLALVAALALGLIGGYSVEDAARAARERAAMPPDALRDLVKDALGGIVDELAERLEAANQRTDDASTAKPR